MEKTSKMASFSLKLTLLRLLFVLTRTSSDPGITQDFLIPPNLNPTTITGDFFTFTGLRGIIGSSVSQFTVTKVTKKEFPALDGQGVSLSILQFPPGSVNPPHYHPRSSEAIYVFNGTLEVGFIDPTSYKLISNTLESGYAYVIPQGVVHYQYNANKNLGATVLSAFGSANAGTASLPTTLFATGVNDAVLIKSFVTDVVTIDKIKAGFGTKV